MEKIVTLLLLSLTAKSVLSLRGAIPEKLTCETYPSECLDTICNMIKWDPLTVSISYGCNLKRMQPKVSVRVQVFKKVRPNKYIPALFDTIIDFCARNLKNDEVFRIFLPGLKEQIEKYTHECPYTDVMAVYNMSIDGRNIPVFLNGANFRVDATFINQKFLTIFKMSMFVKTFT